MPFSSNSLLRALGKIIESAEPIASKAAPILSKAAPIVSRALGPLSIAAGILWPTKTVGETHQPTGAAQAFTEPTVTSTLPTMIKKTAPTKTTSAKAGAVAPTPAAPTMKAAIATPTPAPTPTATPPAPTTAIARTGSAPTPPPTGGYSAPAPAALPPTPVAPGEITQPTTPENLARYDAMIRALQELAGGARYVPTPMVGAEPFGPAGALERALKKLREREIRV